MKNKHIKSIMLPSQSRVVKLPYHKRVWTNGFSNTDPPPPHNISHYLPPDYSSCCWASPHNNSLSSVHWCLYSSGQHIAAGGHTWPGVSGSRPGDWTSVRESRPCPRLSRSLHLKHDNTLHSGSKSDWFRYTKNWGQGV